MTAHIYEGDCLEVMKGFEDNYFDAIVTDPPAGISFMGKKWDGDKGGRDQWIEWMSSVANECIRVIKPGGHAVVWSLPRTSHWTATAWENVEWEVRDKIIHIFGSGFPKSLNLVGGIGTGLKPAHEDWLLFRKPVVDTISNNVKQWGTGGINIDGCRVEYQNDNDFKHSERPNCIGKTFGDQIFSKQEREHPSLTRSGRFPANLIRDGSEEIMELFPYTKSGGKNITDKANPDGLFGFGGSPNMTCPPSAGSAARFFYCAKASQSERNLGLPDGVKNTHPTVKPLALLQYLCRLITPPNGLILDPFAGSGTTGIAATREGFDSVLIEQDPENIKIARRLETL